MHDIVAFFHVRFLCDWNTETMETKRERHKTDYFFTFSFPLFYIIVKLIKINRTFIVDHWKNKLAHLFWQLSLVLEKASNHLVAYRNVDTAAFAIQTYVCRVYFWLTNVQNNFVSDSKQVLNILVSTLKICSVTAFRIILFQSYITTSIYFLFFN